MIQYDQSLFKYDGNVIYREILDGVKHSNISRVACSGTQLKKMKIIKYHTVRTFSKSYRIIVDKEAILISLTLIYMVAHYYGIVQAV